MASTNLLTQFSGLTSNSVNSNSDTNSTTMRRLFKRDELPRDVTVDTIDSINATLKRLRSRKVGLIVPGHGREWTKDWIHIYLQGHIRRTLSLIESGIVEIRNGRPLVAALCARAIFEEAAVVWEFITRVNEFLDKDDDDATEEFVITRTLATRVPHVLKEHGAQFKAVSILTILERFYKLNPGYQAIYDDLSEVVHPNSTGVFHHFAEQRDEYVEFHDGEKLRDTALSALVQATYIFCADEPYIEKLEHRIRNYSHLTSA